MALLADSPADRAEQLILLSDRLRALVEEETARIRARAPTADQERMAEKERLANAYRLELTRIKDDRSLIDTAPKPLLDQLAAATGRLQRSLEEHERELGAVKFIAEGLVQAIAEEVAEGRKAAGAYTAAGGYAGGGGPAPIAINKSA